MDNVSRRTFVKGSAAAACGLGLAACGGSGSSDSSSSGDTIKVGLMGPYTGDVAQYGLACRCGAELYVKQVNDNGGINGKQIELDEQDEKGDATEAVNVYNMLVEDGVVGIIGDVTSTPTIAVAQASVADNMPCVTPSATAADVISYGSNYFRACITDPYQGKLMADFAADQGYQTVGVIFNSGGDYEAGVKDAFVEEAQAKGLTVLDPQGYSSGDTDFNAQLTTIISGNPDAIMSPNYYQDDGKIVTQARTLGYTGPFLGADGWSNIVGGDEEYASAEDLEGCFYDCSFSASNTAENVQQFISDYKAEYNDDPTNFCALGYDAAMVLLNAIQKVEEEGSAETGSDDYKQAVIDAIASGTANGVTGDISYNGTGDPVKSTLIITFKDGEETVYDTIEGE
ncbi:MAG: ABC transporter substrate-binding protein [Tractidigestivibacter sp.]|jgi:branched-chain amino acid transport system substrate-binding protein|uniref:ABC transporter substrate-binding protein n=1 Tax=Tractidigestivibacter sp. TaxID=2847320 RepID=UPI003D8B1B11